MINVVAPEVPAAGLFAVGLLAALTALFLVFLRFAAITLVGSLMRWIAGALSVIPFVGSWTGALIDDAINAVDGALGSAIAASEKLAVSTLHDSWKLTVWVGSSIANLATETLHGFNVLVTHTIPSAVEDAVGHLRGRVETIETTISHLDKAAIKEVRTDIAGVRHEAAAAERRITRDIATVDHAITSTLPRAIGRDLGELRGWTSKQIRRLARRLSAVEDALSLAALSGVIIGVIARELPWIRCKNVGKAGKALCGLPIAQVEKLLAELTLGLTAIFGTLSLESLAKDLQAIIGGVSTEVLHFWRADAAGSLVDPGPGESGL